MELIMSTLDYSAVDFGHLSESDFLEEMFETVRVLPRPPRRALGSTRLAVVSVQHTSVCVCVCVRHSTI